MGFALGGVVARGALLPAVRDGTDEMGVIVAVYVAWFVGTFLALTNA